MSKLMEKLKREAAELKSRGEEASGGGKFEDVQWFQPEKGDNIVRIVPNSKNPDDLFFKKVHIHYIEVAKKDGSRVNVPVRCLRDLADDCPLCDAYDTLVATDKDRAKSFRVAERYLYNVIDYKTKKVFAYAAPMTVHRGIMEWVDEIGSDISDLDNGRDIKIIKTVDPKKGVQFGTSYTVRPSLKDSALVDKLRPLLASAYDLDKLYADARRKDMEEALARAGVATNSTSTSGTKIKAGFDPNEEIGFADEEAERKQSTKQSTKPATMTKSKVTDDDTEYANIDETDDDLEAELKRLGV